MASFTFGNSNSGLQVGHNTAEINAKIYLSSEHIPLNQQCIRDLQITNPHHDKARIEATKGGLLKDAYIWILNNDEFRQWRCDRETRLLWVKGDPGKGKTMLLSGIINELTSLAPHHVAVGFFFCQATDVRLSQATSVLRGLLFMLIDQQPQLISHVRKEYDISGKSLFQDINTWVALKKIFNAMLDDPLLQGAYLIVDALDECTTDVYLLIDLIAEASSVYKHVKWVVSSRNWPEIEERLNIATQKVTLWLEVNEQSVAQAVTSFIHYKVRKLKDLKKYKGKIPEIVTEHLMSNAHGTFLWVALVCEELAKADPWNTHQRLTAFPPGLGSLYESMVLRLLQEKDAQLYQNILATMLAAYRPMTLDELPSLVEMPNTDDADFLEEIVRSCGSFLSVRGRNISFVHQSAKDFLLKHASRIIIPRGIEAEHYNIFRRSIQNLKSLRRDIYSLNSPGTPISQIEPPTPDPLGALSYSCTYWVDHLEEWTACPRVIADVLDFKDIWLIRKFFKESFLHWVEAVGLLRYVSEAINRMIRLQDLTLKFDWDYGLQLMVQDASRFMILFRVAIENSPLQIYYSALVFSPESSITKRHYLKSDGPSWIRLRPYNKDSWSSGPQTLEGHGCGISLIAWAPCGRTLASGSNDGTVKIWNPSTGQCLSSCQGHQKTISAVAWSPNGYKLASGSKDGTVRIWDLAGDCCHLTLQGPSNNIRNLKWSQDGNQIIVFCVSFEDIEAVKIWDMVAGNWVSAWEGRGCRSYFPHDPHKRPLTALVKENEIEIYDVKDQTCLSALEGHKKRIISIVWSDEGTLLASGSKDHTVRVWNPTTGQCLLIIRERRTSPASLVWAPGGCRLFCLWNNNSLQAWEVPTAQCLSMLQACPLTWPVWSPDGAELALLSRNNHTIGIWDLISKGASSLRGNSSANLPSLRGHTGLVTCVSWLNDGTRLASGSLDGTIKIWDIESSLSDQSTEQISCIAWSWSGTWLVSGTNNGIIRIWNAEEYRVLFACEAEGSLCSVAWSRDDKHLASAFYYPSTELKQLPLEVSNCGPDPTKIDWPNIKNESISDEQKCRIFIWDSKSGARLSSLQGHTTPVDVIAWSPNERHSLLASGSRDNTINIWDVATKTSLFTFSGETIGNIRSIAWAPDGCQIASWSTNHTVSVWHVSDFTECKRIKDVTSPDCFEFDPWIPGCLHTSEGPFYVRDTASTKVFPMDVYPRKPIYRIDSTSAWITYKGQNILWLPPKYRPLTSAVSGSYIAIGTSASGLLILTFPIDGPPHTRPNHA